MKTRSGLAHPAVTGGLRVNADALALSRACATLWMATLSLMTAFMQTGAMRNDAGLMQPAT